jgi:predicted DsbA family dithiol-disulfide isomerase
MFANPIGGHCLTTEVNIMRGLKQHQQRAQINLVPMTNMRIVTDYLQINHLDDHDLALRNQVMTITYQSMLDFKAASFQGNKKARAFIMSLQEHLCDAGLSHYSDQLVEQIADEVQLDQDTFWDDRKGQLVQDLCHADRQLANDLGVLKTPSTVFVDYRHNPDGDGILINGSVSQVLIDQLLEDKLPQQQSDFDSQRPVLKIISSRTLSHLI